MKYSVDGEAYETRENDWHDSDWVVEMDGHGRFAIFWGRHHDDADAQMWEHRVPFGAIDVGAGIKPSPWDDKDAVARLVKLFKMWQNDEI